MGISFKTFFQLPLSYSFEHFILFYFIYVQRGLVIYKENNKLYKIYKI